MIKQGEIISLENRVATVRIYKNGEPSSLKIKALSPRGFVVTDFVEVNVHPLKFALSLVFAYLFPFILAISAYMISSSLTENMAIIQVVLLLSLLLSYFTGVFFEKSEFFKRLAIGTIRGYSE